MFVPADWLGIFLSTNRILTRQNSLQQVDQIASTQNSDKFAPLDYGKATKT